MNRILLLLEHRENRRLLCEWLEPRYAVIAPDWEAETISDTLMSHPFDLCIVGARALDQFWQAVQARRIAEQPVLLPFLLATSRQDVKYVTRRLWQSIDELITQPIEKAELQARVEILLRSRQLSLQLQTAKQKLEQQMTARQQAEIKRDRAIVAQHDSEDRFRQMAETIQSAFWLLDLQSQQMLYLSPAYEQIWGRAREELYANLGLWMQTIHPDDRRQVTMVTARCLAEGSQEQEYRIVRPDQTMRWIRDRCFVVYDSDGEPYRLAGVAEDITERKQAEAERERLLQREQTARETAEQANRIKDEFLAVLSHELRSPLNPILGWTKLLRSREFDATATDRALETIERNARIQTQLIEDLLDISRILNGKLRLTASPVDLTAIIRAALETVRLAAEAKSIQIQTQLDPAASQVLGDAARLQQVMWNLLSNAIKFTPEAGRVEIRLEQVGAQAQLQISDTGKGIKPEFLPHVFDTFRQADGTTTRRFGGLGLGLAIVRHLVELHGGTVEVESPGEGLGATFTVRLSLTAKRSERPPATCPDRSTIRLDGLRVLVVDDEADMRDLAGFILEQHGAEVSVVASAVEALTVLDQFIPDILISDIGMPEMDGYMLMGQVRDRLTKNGRQIPAIALSAYAREVDQKQAIAAGFQQHLSKPIEPQALVMAIATLSGRSSGNRAID